MITRLLVANRGEIARRVFATCRRLGIETVAVHSDADADLPFVREADQVVHLRGTAPADTYLRADLILEAARRTGADAIHPGYGFLSENADFARAVLGAGLTWVGPAPDSIERMGSKVESKKLMEAAGVPVLGNLTPETATEADLPLLVKASAGGGGRGMRIVRTLADLPAEIEKAAAEAESAFGDGTVFVEPYVEHGRHVEVQVVGHAAGVLVLGERDCSIQRRHQKVVEETPAPGLAEKTRRALHGAAHAAAAAIDYLGAGTVEFLVDARDTRRFWFLEMNTRLQVEHPVTELVYGVDLVRLQLEVAEGAALPAPPQPRGHAVEVRLYAEDHDYLPQTGVLRRFEIPGDVRVDSGVESGSTVSPHYDAMLAKIIAYGATRTEATRKLTTALRSAKLHGLTTNRDLLLKILTNPAFLAGDTNTAFLSPDGPLDSPSPHPPTGLPALAAALALAAANRQAAAVLATLPSGWRNVRSQPARARFDQAEVVYDPVPDGIVVVRAEPSEVILEHDGVRQRFEIARYDGDDRVYVDSPTGSAELTPVPRLPEPVEHVAPGSLLAPMPGSVLRVEVAPGDTVTKGQPVLALEAMKMEHQIAAPADGVVAAVHVEKGQQVEAGAVLAIIQEESP
jgi:propionyl-CoA carboxylase alpha chain